MVSSFSRIHGHIIESQISLSFPVRIPATSMDALKLFDFVHLGAATLLGELHNTHYSRTYPPPSHGLSPARPLRACDCVDTGSSRPLLLFPSGAGRYSPVPRPRGPPPRPDASRTSGVAGRTISPRRRKSPTRAFMVAILYKLIGPRKKTKYLQLCHCWYYLYLLFVL
jgi:hypothetical protein